ncbi:MAG: hypothetical protein P8179_17780, partial [Candidatus Thiodiazotropha sp.]
MPFAQLILSYLPESRRTSGDRYVITCVQAKLFNLSSSWLQANPSVVSYTALGNQRAEKPSYARRPAQGMARPFQAGQRSRG